MSEVLEVPVEQLDATEADRLAEDEQIIERGVRDVGEALADIRDNRLYRVTHPTFEAYLKDRWGMARPTGYSMIDAFRATRQIEQVTGEGSLGRDMPKPSQKIASEFLAPLGRDDEQAEQVAQAWQTVVQQHEGDGPITTREAKRTLTEAGFIPDTRATSRGSQTGLNEKLGAVGDALISAESRLAKVEAAMSRKPSQKFRAMAEQYAARADALAERLRQWDAPAEESTAASNGDDPGED